MGACVVGEPCAPHRGHSHLGPGAPAALGERGRAAGGLLAGAEPTCVRLHQSPRPAPLQVRDPLPSGSCWGGWGRQCPRAKQSQALLSGGRGAQQRPGASSTSLHPFPRQARESGAFPFCTSGRWTAGERVARDGMGLRGAWWRQVRQFNRVSPAVADAVVSAFPSPRLLQQVGARPHPDPRYGGRLPRPAAHPCALPRRTRPVARSRSAWPCLLTSR